MLNTDRNISRSPFGVPATGDNEFTGIVQAESADEAPPAFLWEDAADASSDPDVFRLDEDLSKAA